METPTFTSALIYADPQAAIAWLERAFGFELTMAIEGPPGEPDMCHYEMSCNGHGRVMIGGQWSEHARSPKSIGGTFTQAVHVMLNSDVDAHCEHARSEGATIEMEPADQFYGDRTYAVRDLEGHRWTFSQQVRVVSRAEAEKALGQPIFATTWE